MGQSNFRESNLLIVDKKKKFVGQPNRQSQDDEGVLSIPPEDAPNNCKSKSPYHTLPFTQYLSF